jgi:hypothetical protein
MERERAKNEGSKRPEDSEIAVNASLALIEGAKPHGEIEA